MNNGQGSSEAQRWDGNDDYKSLACIKVSHSDMSTVHSYWASWDGRHSFSEANGLHVG